MAEDKKYDDWASPTLKEAPFYYPGITPEEYDEENRYLNVNFDKLQNGTYKPLWKQRKEK